MRNDGHINNVEDLKNWFELNQGKESKPFFTIWRGTEPQQNRLIFRNEEISDTASSWEKLQEVIEWHSSDGGIFRIFLTSKPGYHLGVQTILKIPNNNAGVAGIHGAGANAGVFGIYGSAREMIEAEIERRMEVYELKRELEDVRAGQTGMNGVEQIRQIFEAVPALNPLAHALGMKIMGMTPAPAPPPPSMGEGIGDDVSGYDYDTVEPALDKLRRVFPNVEMTLDHLADWALQNPDMARQLFGNIKQPGTQ